MVETIQEYLCRYINEQAESLKGCLIAAFDSREHYLSLLDESLGTPVPSKDVKLCEILTSSGLFREEVHITRDGRNRYKVFYLTDSGIELSKTIKAEGFSGPIPQNTPINNL